MRAAAWETEPQIALRSCSKEAGVVRMVVKDEYMSDFGEGGVQCKSGAYFTKGFLLVTMSWCPHEEI